MSLVRKLSNDDLMAKLRTLLIEVSFDDTMNDPIENDMQLIFNLVSPDEFIIARQIMVKKNQLMIVSKERKIYYGQEKPYHRLRENCKADDK